MLFYWVMFIGISCVAALFLLWTLFMLWLLFVKIKRRTMGMDAHSPGSCYPQATGSHVSFFSTPYRVFGMCFEKIMTLSCSYSQHKNLPHSSMVEAKWKILLSDKDRLLFPVLRTKSWANIKVICVYINNATVTLCFVTKLGHYLSTCPLYQCFELSGFAYRDISKICKQPKRSIAVSLNRVLGHFIIRTIESCPSVVLSHLE